MLKVRTVRLVAEPLERALFSGFGQILHPGTDLWWAPAMKQSVVLSLRRFGGEALRFSVMRRSRLIGSTWVPLGGKPWVFAVGPPTDEMTCRALPSERQLRAFACDGTVGIRIAPGVWHTEPFALDEVNIAQISGGSADPKDLPEKRDFRKIFGIRFEIVPPRRQNSGARIKPAGVGRV